MPQPGSLIERTQEQIDVGAYYLSELPDLKNGQGDEAKAPCPFHAETQPSLSVNLKSGLYNCFGCGAKGNIFTFYQNRHGCDFKTALHALARIAGVEETSGRPKGLTLAELAGDKHLPVESLKKWGAGNIDYNGRPAVYIPYRDLEGKTTDRFRLNLKTEPRMIWRKGSKTLLYGLWRLPEFKESNEIFLVEGETDCWTLWEYGIPAQGLPGKTNFKPKWAKFFEGKTVYLWVEPDAPELPGKLAKHLPGLLVIEAPPGIKDISEAHIQGKDVPALIEDLKKKAKPVAPEACSTETRSTKTQIYITKRFLNHISDDAIEALEKANNPPFLFVRSGSLARVSLDEKDTPRIVALNDVQLRGMLARHAFFFKDTENGPVPTSPPLDVVKDILHLGEWPFPALEGIVQSPVLRPDGSILVEPGYDPETRLYYINPPDLFLPSIPDSPTANEIKEALGYLLEIICDFPFVEDSDRANALGLIFTLPLRPTITGNVPMAAITAPAPGTGKSLLTEIVSLLGTGKVAPMAGLPRDDDELKKFITSRLIAGDRLITFDNLELPLWGPSLSRALTCTTWDDRVLGQSMTIQLPQRAVWIANGNNLKLRGDLPRRTFPIRLDAKLAKPWERKDFKRRDLRDWVLRWRGDFLSAILTLGRAWFVAGKPEPKNPLPVMGGFEGWSKTIGGILSFAGVDGFLGNLKQFHDEADLEGPEWESFLNAWDEAIGDIPKTCQEVAGILRENSEFAATLPDNLQDVLKDPNRSFERSLGRALARKEKRPYGEKNLALQRDRNTRDKVTLWKVAPL
jgi:hypothetical protein